MRQPLWSIRYPVISAALATPRLPHTPFAAIRMPILRQRIVHEGKTHGMIDGRERANDKQTDPDLQGCLGESGHDG